MLSGERARRGIPNAMREREAVQQHDGIAVAPDFGIEIDFIDGKMHGGASLSERSNGLRRSAQRWLPFAWNCDKTCIYILHRV